jgi:hypothetical protein
LNIICSAQQDKDNLASFELPPYTIRLVHCVLWSSDLPPFITC